MRPIPVLLVVLILLQGGAYAVVNTQPNRIDIESVRPGTIIDRAVTVENRGTEPTAVRVDVTTFESELFSVTPREFSLAPQEARVVAMSVELAKNTSGGRHDLRLSFTEAVAQSSGKVRGQAAVEVPLIFHVENLKIGNLQVTDSQVGNRSEASALIQNFLKTDAEPTLTLEVLNDAGRAVKIVTLPAGPVAVNATLPVTVPLPVEDLAAGVYRVAAVARFGDNVSNTFAATLRVGEKKLAAGEVRVENVGTKTVLTTEVTNPGSVALDGRVRFYIYDADGNLVTVIEASPASLLPGQKRDVAIEMALAPGTYTAKAVVDWAGGAIETHNSDVVSSGQPMPPAGGGGAILWLIAGIVAFVGGTLVALGRHKRRGSR